jgi:hypothetical protein
VDHTSRRSHDRSCRALRGASGTPASLRPIRDPETFVHEVASPDFPAGWRPPERAKSVAHHVTPDKRGGFRGRPVAVYSHIVPLTATEQTCCRRRERPTGPLEVERSRGDHRGEKVEVRRPGRPLP